MQLKRIFGPPIRIRLVDFFGDEMILLFRLSFFFLMMGGCATPSADENEEMTYEELVAAMDAHTAACIDLDPESIKRSRLAVNKRLTDQQRADIPCIRTTDIYAKNFEWRFGRLMSYKIEARKRACAAIPPDMKIE